MSRSELSLHQTRQIALRAQGLDRRRLRSVPSLLERLGAVQLDTISVLARSHELIAYARLGAVGRARVESAYWGNGRTFEYWSHAACILPIERYPDFAFRMRESQSKAERWGASARAVDTVRAALRGQGPQTATELGGARRSTGWWNWSDAKNAVEWMLATGEVVVTDRRSWKRVYDLAEQALTITPEPHWVDVDGVVGPADARCARDLLLASVRMLGVGTFDDIRDVHRLPRSLHSRGPGTGFVLRDELQSLVDSGEVMEVRVAGWSEVAYADPSALRRIDAQPTSLSVLLSPFDSLVWHRPRLERIFDVRLRIEAYTPKAQRVLGYFAMPVLHEGAIVGFIDPARDRDVLVARRITALRGRDDGFAAALAGAATWVGSTAVRVDEAVGVASADRIEAAANALLRQSA